MVWRKGLSVTIPCDCGETQGILAIYHKSPSADSGPPQRDQIWVCVPWLALHRCRLLFNRSQWCVLSGALASSFDESGSPRSSFFVLVVKWTKVMYYVCDCPHKDGNTMCASLTLHPVPVLVLPSVCGARRDRGQKKKHNEGRYLWEDFVHK